MDQRLPMSLLPENGSDRLEENVLGETHLLIKFLDRSKENERILRRENSLLLGQVHVLQERAQTLERQTVQPSPDPDITKAQSEAKECLEATSKCHHLCEEMKEKIQSLTTQNELKSKELTHLRNKLVDPEASLPDLKKERDGLISELGKIKLQAKADATTASLIKDTFAEQLRKAESDCKNSKTETQKLQSDIRSMKDRRDTKIEQLQREVEELRSMQVSTSKAPAAYSTNTASDPELDTIFHELLSEHQVLCLHLEDVNEEASQEGRANAQGLLRKWNLIMPTKRRDRDANIDRDADLGGPSDFTLAFDLPPSEENEIAHDTNNHDEIEVKKELAVDDRPRQSFEKGAGSTDMPIVIDSDDDTIGPPKTPAKSAKGKERAVDPEPRTPIRTTSSNTSYIGIPECIKRPLGTIPNFSVGRPSSPIQVRRRGALVHHYGLSNQQFLRRPTKKGGRFQRGIIFPQRHLNPFIPTRIGERGVMFGMRKDMVEAGERFSLFVECNQQGPPMLEYKGEYVFRILGKLPASFFTSRDREFQDEWVDAFATQPWTEHAAVQARVYLRKTHSRLSQKQIMEETARAKHQKGDWTFGHLGLSLKEDIRQAFILGQEQLNIVGMECVSYDLKFAEELLENEKKGEETSAPKHAPNPSKKRKRPNPSAVPTKPVSESSSSSKTESNLRRSSRPTKRRQSSNFVQFQDADMGEDSDFVCLGVNIRSGIGQGGQDSDDDLYSSD